MQRCTCKGCHARACGQCESCKAKALGVNLKRTICHERICTGNKINTSGLRTTLPAPLTLRRAANTMRSKGVSRPQASLQSDKVKDETKVVSKEEQKPKRESPRKAEGNLPGDIQLPKIVIHKHIRKEELRRILLELIKMTVGKEWDNGVCKKPRWWPAGRDWIPNKTIWDETTLFRNQLLSIIYRCYQNLGQRDRVENEPEDVSTLSSDDQSTSAMRVLSPLSTNSQSSPAVDQKSPKSASQKPISAKSEQQTPTKNRRKKTPSAPSSNGKNSPASSSNGKTLSASSSNRKTSPASSSIRRTQSASSSNRKTSPAFSSNRKTSSASSSNGKTSSVSSSSRKTPLASSSNMKTSSPSSSSRKTPSTSSSNGKTLSASSSNGKTSSASSSKGKTPSASSSSGKTLSASSSGGKKPIVSSKRQPVQAKSRNTPTSSGQSTPTKSKQTKQSPSSVKSGTSPTKTGQSSPNKTRPSVLTQTPVSLSGKIVSGVRGQNLVGRMRENPPLAGNRQTSHNSGGYSPVAKHWPTSQTLLLQTPLSSYGQPSPALSIHRMQGKSRPQTGVPPTTESQQASSTAEIGQIQSSPIKMTTFPQGLFFPFSTEIYICYFCEEEFLNKQKMRDHQKVCSERPPQLQQYQLEVVTDHNVEDREPPQMSPQRRVIPKSSPLPLREFTNYLDLLPKQTAAKLRAHRASMEIDCDLDELETTLPVSPVTPRTPKSLISQLSREEAGVLAKKRLSYSLSIEAKDACESSDSENEKDETFTTTEKKGLNLLTIPISSLLGQRVKNFVHVESPTPVVENTESFCRTPVKNSFLEKLRKKDATYSIVYKPLRRFNLHKQSHVYKFNKLERRRFLCKLNTGLNLSCYNRYKSLKITRVNVERIGRSQLLRWVSAPHLDYIMNKRKHQYRPIRYRLPSVQGSDKCEFPAGPTLLSPNIDKLLGLKKKSSQTPQSPVCSPLSIGNFISEEMEAEVSKQKLTLYRCLLYEMSVLKAAVIMKDIGGGPELTSPHKPSKPPTMIASTSSTGTTQQKDVFTVKPIKQKQPVTPVIHNQPVNKTPSSTHYSTIKTLLVSQNTDPSLERPRTTLPAPYSCNTRQADIQATKLADRQRTCDLHKETSIVNNPCTNNKQKVHPEGNMASPLSVVIASPSSKVSALDGELLSPDDAVSITSLSSDSDTPNPRCCIGCKVKLLNRSCTCTSASTPTLQAKSPQRQLYEGNMSMMAPLNVAVAQVDLYPSGLDPSDAMCDIPSPISNRSESPIPHTPTKHSPSSEELDSDINIMEYESRENVVDSPRFLRSGKKQISQEKSHLPTEKKITKEKTSQSFCGKLQSLRHSDRSKSVTPSSSPYKLDSPKSCSFPGSPAKSFINSSYSSRAPSISSTKRVILCSTPVSSLRTRSKSSCSDSKQGLYSSDQSQSVKTVSHLSVEQIKKDMNLTKSASTGFLEKDIQPRRSKRRLSSYSIESPAHKVRRLSNQATANS